MVTASAAVMTWMLVAGLLRSSHAATAPAASPAPTAACPAKTTLASPQLSIASSRKRATGTPGTDVATEAAAATVSSTKAAAATVTKNAMATVTKKAAESVTAAEAAAASVTAATVTKAAKTATKTARTSDSTTTSMPFDVNMIRPFGRSTIWYRRVGPTSAAAVNTPEPVDTVPPDQARGVTVQTPYDCDGGSGEGGGVTDGLTTKAGRRRRRRRKKTTATDGRRATNTVLPLPGYPVDNDAAADDDDAAGPPRHAFQVPADQLRLLYTVQRDTTAAGNAATTTTTASPEDEADEVIHV